MPPSSPTPSPFADRHVTCIGIGGCGLSGLALMLQSLGARCRGSDATPSVVTDGLQASGIEVSFDQAAGQIPDACDLVIASAAVPDDHPEVRAARARGLEVITYAEALGRTQAAHTGISIAGTHGKSTTAAMLCHVMLECGLDPSFIVGAQCNQIGGGSRTGAGAVPGDGPYRGRPGYLVAEACEFNRSFHHHRPVIAAILNVEEDHLDVYGSLEHVVEAFHAFADLVPAAAEGGRLLIAHEGAHRRVITRGLQCGVATFGFSPAADYQVVTDGAVRRVGLLQDGLWLAQWTNAMPGEHNALNAAAAVILAHDAGADWEAAAAALDGFAGLDRRMQRLGTRVVRGGPIVVYDDYGHHPTEIDKTLRALRAAERPQRLVCVFQPHQHSRTRFLLDEFAQSLAAADIVIVPDIYFVRDSELERQRVSSTDLVSRLTDRGVSAMHLTPFDAIVDQLEVMSQGGDLLVIMGAGPVWQIGAAFMDREAAATPLPA
ncbi:MAG: UDP-N-acetylmuramate--L-alanine ligase [Phycisphaerales bacterium]|nr:UDP-N-acetylmuramate--L-alanine ligase [Phycisphaerales bacterium]NNM25322.1 UDP-N-acetylmuramate--L-alanine ligase [Phycisphaerales bacterium]